MGLPRYLLLRQDPPNQLELSRVDKLRNMFTVFFKIDVKRLFRITAMKEDEWMVEPSPLVPNRLRNLGVDNKHACIKGCVELDTHEAKAVAKQILMWKCARKTKRPAPN